MLAIGRALMARPRVLLLDEPSMGLAPMVISQIFKIISEINAQGTTVLLVEQNAQQALSRSDRAYILETGSVTRTGDARELLADDSIRAAYLAWREATRRANAGICVRSRHPEVVMVGKSIALFVLAAVLEIGGAWLVWQGVREHRGWIWMGAGVIALGAYGFVAAFQPDAHFGRVLAAYGGVFIAGSLLWGMVADGFRPDRWDVVGALVAVVGVGLIMYAPR